jgi:hypothetical protein
MNSGYYLPIFYISQLEVPLFAVFAVADTNLGVCPTGSEKVLRSVSTTIYDS